MKFLRLSRAEVFWMALYLAILWLFTVMISYVNSDLLVGRFALFMDERITFDGVRNILHSQDINSFFWNIYDGGDHRYGRSLWNTMALFAYLPEYLGGESGQIFAGRMAQVAILLSAFILFTVSLTRHWFFRLLLLAVLLSMPYTSYYMTLPKPEPQQLLFLALYFYFVSRGDGRIGGKKWIFLGLAFGAKISTLPLLLAVIMFSIFYALYEGGKRYDGQSVFLSSVFFLVGLSLSVPILIYNAIVSIIVLSLVYKITASRLIDHKLWIGILVMILAVVFSNVALEEYLKSEEIRSGLLTWLNATFFNTSHGADSSSIGLLEWINYYFRTWMASPMFVSVVFVVTLLVSVGFYLSVIFKPGAKRIARDKMLAVIFMASGLVLNLAIFINVQRLWGFYLFTGMAMVLAGYISILEHQFLFANQSDQASQWRRRSFRIGISFFGILIIFAYVFYFWPVMNYDNYSVTATRTETAKFKEQYQSYLEVTEFLEEYSSKAGKRLLVAYDPVLYLPESNENYRVIEFWGPYSNWTINRDVIVFGESHSLSHTPIPEGSPNYRRYLEERSGYDKYVIDKGVPCKMERCYEKALELSAGGEVLVSVSRSNH